MNIHTSYKKNKLSKLFTTFIIGSAISTVGIYAAPITTNYTGTLNNDSSFYRPGGAISGQLTAGSMTTQTSNLFNYSTTLLTPNVTGSYNITTISSEDTFLLLYSSFNPNNPLDNLIVANDDDGTGNNALLSAVSLTENSNYTLILTTYRAGIAGDINYQVIGPGSMVFSGGNSSYLDQTVAGNGNSPSKGNAQRLDSFVGTGMNDFKTVLDACSNDKCVAKAIDELEVKLASAGVGAAKQTAQSISKIVRQRQGTFGISGANSGEEMFTERNFWMKPFGTWGKQNDKDGLSGYDISSYGFGIGYDGIDKDDQQLGFGLFYTNANVDVNGVNQSSDVEAVTILGYGSTPIIDNKTKLLYQVGYSWQMTDTFRETVTGNALADYTSKVASIDLKLMRDYKINDEWLIQPNIGLNYTHFTAPSYSESGAGVASLDVNKFTTSEVLLNIGAVSNYQIDDNSKIITSLDLSYDMQDKNNKISSTTQGGLQLADSESIDNGRVSYALGLGYEIDLKNNSNINFAYEYSGEGSGYSNNTISAKYVIIF